MEMGLSGAGASIRESHLKNKPKACRYPQLIPRSFGTIRREHTQQQTTRNAAVGL